MPTVFVSYRQQDTSDICDRITEHIERRYGKRQVFRDVSTLLAGSDFPYAIRHALAESRVVLVLIGPRWLDIRNERGERRLDDPNDFVRLEVATALREGKMVIPVLVRGARMPMAAELPADLQPLTMRRPFGVRGDPYFREDIEMIYHVIGGQAAWRPAHLGVLAGGIIMTVGFILTLAFKYAGFTSAEYLSVEVALFIPIALIPLALLRVLTTRRWPWLAIPLAIAASLAAGIYVQEVNLVLFYFCLIALCSLSLMFGAIGPVRLRRTNLRRDTAQAWRLSSIWILTLSVLSLLGIGTFTILAILRIHGTFNLAAALLSAGIIMSFVPWALASWRCLRTGQWRWLLALLTAVCVYLLLFALTIALHVRGIVGLLPAIGPDVMLLVLLIGFGRWGLRQGTIDASEIEQTPVSVVPTA